MLRAQVHHRANSLFPVSGLVQGFTQHEGSNHEFANSAISPPSSYEFISVEVPLRPEQVRGTGVSQLAKSIEEVADALAKKHSEAFYKVFDRVVETTGAKIEAEDGVLTQKVALEMIDRVEWSPDTVFLAHPIMAQQMSATWKQWEKDDAFMKRYRELEAKKKEEFRAREDRRKLVK